MRVTCERCHVEYELGDHRVPPGGTQVECTRCHHVFVARRKAPELADTVILNRTETELLASLLADLELLRQPPALYFLGEGDTEPTLRSKPEVLGGLREIPNVRQVPGESHRRWFTSNDLDLILWLGPRGQPHGFQLCYGKVERKERALTWWPERGLTHSSVDDSRSSPLGMKGTPVLSTSQQFDRAEVLQRFLSNKGELANDIVDFVTERLK